MSDAEHDKAAGDEYTRSELVDSFNSVHIRVHGEPHGNLHGNLHGNVQSYAPPANCKSRSSESTASANSDQFAGDEKREPFERNFLQLKTTCSTLFEKFTNRINNYYIVTRNGINSSAASHLREERSPTARPPAVRPPATPANPPANHPVPNRSAVSASISSSPLLLNSHSPQDCITSPNVNCTTNSAVSAGANSDSNASNQPLVLNRNLAARRSSRSNLGNETVGQQFKMTRDQLSPAVNAQCLSPRPRPKDLNMAAPSLKKSSQQNPIGLLNTSLVTRNNFIHINGQEYAIDEADFRYIEQLGAGTCGTVNKMEHIRSKAIVAVKEMTRSSHPEDNKRINMDLEVLLKCNNVEHIVQCYGYLIKGTRVWIVMELMTTCLDKLLKKINSPFPEPICGKIAVASIKSLDYLKTQHAVIHRDPSNILINSQGEIKLCDFGVSGRLVDSYAKTKQGCEAYMAPERILPPDPKRPSYDIRADVWSLGITLVQLALGRYPYQNCKGDFELLTKIIESEPPILPENSTFSNYFREFIKLCLQKDVEKRPKYKYLKWDPFYLKYDREAVDIKGWFEKVWS